ncbi:MAG: LysM peptidoglycan-binding domain-containing protein, partial [Acidobacteria bacterium]|nr:LysM peptidoglycan-binding domain-containing protein [Acidobacteriota bacterium]
MFRKVCARGVAFVALATVTVVAAGPSSATVGATGARSAIAGVVQSHVVVPGDTVTSVSARFGVEPSVIIADNRLASSGALRVGQTLQLDSRHIIPRAGAPDTVVIN